MVKHGPKKSLAVAKERFVSTNLRLMLIGLKTVLVRNLTPLLILFCIALPQGGVFIRNIGPYSVPDPGMHAGTSYALATGQSFNKVVMVTDEFGNEIKYPAITGDNRYLTNQLPYNKVVSSIIGNPLELDPTLDAQYAQLTQPGRTVTASPRATQYTPIGYIPQALGLRVAWLMDMDPYASLQFARLANFCVFLLLFALAVIFTPQGKFILVAVACIPPSCYAGSSLMTDGTFMAITALFVALILRASNRTVTMSGSMLALFIVLTAFLVLGKPPYATVALLLLVIPRSVLSVKRKIIFLASSAVFCVLYLLWNHMYCGILYNVNYINNVNYASGHFIKVLVIAFVNIIFMSSTTLSFTYFSVVSVVIVLLVWTYYLASLAKTGGKAASADTLSGWACMNRYAIASAAAGFTTLMLTVLFVALTYNDLSQTRVFGALLGVQGRYVLPSLPLLIALLPYSPAMPADDSSDVSSPVSQ